MKEITFEELIEDKLTATKEGYVVYTDDIKELLQQVREATKAECRDIASEFSLSETLKHIDNLPTDRIKTDK